MNTFIESDALLRDIHQPHVETSRVVNAKFIIPGLPSNTIICISGHPEEIGKIGYDNGAYGITLLNVSRIRVVEVIPTPFGSGSDRILEP